MRVGVVGVGGLGSPALWSLGALRPSLVRIWDPDRLELGNLHRQIIYAEADVGRPKAHLAAQWFRMRSPGSEVEAIAEAFDEGATIDDLELVLDCSDGFETKLLVNRACVRARVPFVFASSSSWSGQVLGVRPRTTACVACVFGEIARPEAFPTCAEVGAFGPLLGQVAARQVRVGMGLLEERGPEPLHVFDQGERMPVVVERRPDCPYCSGRASASEAIPTPSPEEAAPSVDLRGLRCPATYVETRRRLERLPLGARLWIVFDSDESARTVPRSAVAAGHRLVSSRSEGGVHRVLLERGS
ncbi:MAG: ThiF family adenylyltransferase [Myxococcota bacterium]